MEIGSFMSRTKGDRNVKFITKVPSRAEVKKATSSFTSTPLHVRTACNVTDYRHNRFYISLSLEFGFCRLIVSTSLSEYLVLPTGLRPLIQFRSNEQISVKSEVFIQFSLTA